MQKEILPATWIEQVTIRCLLNTERRKFSQWLQSSERKFQCSTNCSKIIWAKWGNKYTQGAVNKFYKLLWKLYSDVKKKERCTDSCLYAHKPETSEWAKNFKKCDYKYAKHLESVRYYIILFNFIFDLINNPNFVANFTSPVISD